VRHEVVESCLPVASASDFRYLNTRLAVASSIPHPAGRLLCQTHDCVSKFCERTTHMKFAREYRAHLEAEGYPPDWVDSAVSYSKLKKCVNRVQLELSALGLDVETLRQLLTAVEKDQARQGVRDGRPFQYRFADGEDPDTIRPELLFVVDGETGEPLDAGLAPGTKSYLHRLAVTEQLTEVRIVDDAASMHATEDDIEAQGDGSSPRRRLVRVPLSSDSDFFSLLEKDLCSVAGLQAVRKQRLTEEIMDVARMLGKATNPELSSKSKHDLAQWRRLFELYLQCNVFFAMNEQDHGTQSGSQARIRFAKFLETAQKSSLLSHFKTRESKAALQNFVAINTELLQFVRFWEINQLAMVKILKSTTLEIGMTLLLTKAEFDKRTALGAKRTFPTHLPASILSQDLSKVLSAEVSNKILAVVPQLDDYLCPICFAIAYRPIRLSCGHLFCIRCLIVMQREGQKRCALCREDVVMEADSSAYRRVSTGTGLTPSQPIWTHLWPSSWRLGLPTRSRRNRTPMNEQSLSIDTAKGLTLVV
jgi:E3 ubiquitin-protein ligase BAH